MISVDLMSPITLRQLCSKIECAYHVKPAPNNHCHLHMLSNAFKHRLILNRTLIIN